MSETNGKLQPHNPAPQAKEERVRLDKPGLWTIRVTPEIAYEWLTKNYHQNRPIKPSHVAYLADEMRAGRWLSDHPDAILFDEDGEMIEGQHRITAVVESECTVMMRVETGVQKSLYPYLDSGLVRSLADRVRFDDNHKRNRIIIQLLNFFHARKNGAETHTGKRTHRLDPETAHEIYKKHKAAIHLASKVHRNIRGIGRIPILGAICEFFERDAGKAGQFCETFFSANGEGTCAQARLLRDSVLRKFQPGKMVVGGDDTSLYHLAVSAMKAFQENRHPTRIVSAEW